MLAELMSWQETGGVMNDDDDDGGDVVVLDVWLVRKDQNEK